MKKSAQFYLFNLIISLLFFLFIFSSPSFAATFYDTTPPSGPNYTSVSPELCGGPAECANSHNAGNCGFQPCSGGLDWYRYAMTCVKYQATPFEDPTYDAYYERGPAVCAIGDKCVGGEEGLRSGSCTCGNYSPNIYKYCCSASGAAEACTSSGVSQDLFPPPEGQCPGGYIVNGDRVRSSECTPIIEPPPPPPGPSCGDGVCNNGETQQSCPQDCGSPPPPSPPGPSCGELLYGSLSQPTPGSSVSSPVTFSGQYWAQPGKCVSFEVHPTDSYIAVDEGSSTQQHFNFSASDMNNGFFNKSINLSPGNHNVFVHIEGWCPPEGRNGYVRLPIQGASCGSETITVSQANQPPTCNISTDPTPQAPQGTIVAISVTGTDATRVQTIQTTYPGGGHTFTNTGSPTSYTIEDSWNTTGVAPTDYSVSAIVTDNNGSATSCSKTYKVTQPGQWTPPFCNGQTFVGCTQQGGVRCSDWGNPANSDWSICQNACNRTNPNTYCDTTKVSGSAQCSGTDSQITWSWQGGSTGKYSKVILHNDTLGASQPFTLQPNQTSLVTGQLPEENKLWLEVYDSNNTFIGSSTIVTSLKCSSTTPGGGGSVPGCTKCATSAAAAGNGCNYAFNSSLDNACSQANGVSSGYYCYLCSQSSGPPPESPGYITVKVSVIEDQADKPSPYPVCNYPMGKVDGSSGTLSNNQSCLYTDLSPHSTKGVAGANIQIVCQYANRSSGGSTGITGSEGAVYLQVYRPYEGNKPAEQPKMTCNISVVAPQDYSSSYATCRKQYTYRGYDGFTGAYDQSPSQQITTISGDSCLDFFESENHSAPNGPDAGFTAKTFTDPPAAIFVLRKIPGAWIQTTGGDVHSNTRIDTPGGPP